MSVRNSARNAQSQPAASGSSAMLSRSCCWKFLLSRFCTLTAILVCNASTVPRVRSPALGRRCRTGAGPVDLFLDGSVINAAGATPNCSAKKSGYSVDSIPLRRHFDMSPQEYKLSDCIFLSSALFSQTGLVPQLNRTIASTGTTASR